MLEHVGALGEMMDNSWTIVDHFITVIMEKPLSFSNQQQALTVCEGGSGDGQGVWDRVKTLERAL